MSADNNSSFSPGRKWSIGLNVALVILVVLAVMVMLNYLSRDYFVRLQLSTKNKIQLAPRTLSLLNSITNRVKIILYYDRKEPLYSTVSELLNQYSLINPKISVQTVDYLRDPSAAQKVKTDYKLSSATDKNLIIFDCDGWVVPVDGTALTHYIYEQVSGGKQPEYRKKPTEFEGETHFTAALLAVTNPKVLNAFFLQNHREHSIENGGDYGYLKFNSILNQNHIRAQALALLGTNTIPADCNLLVIAGPSEKVFDEELDKIDKYLAEGGRLLVLFNSYSINRETGAEITGLDKMLRKWGIDVGAQTLRDPDHFLSWKNDLVIVNFSQKHPLVNPLLGSALYWIRPRAVGKVRGAPPSADGLRIEELAFTGPRAFAGEAGSPQMFPLMVAVEKGTIQAVSTERGTTRIVACGDSMFLANGVIDSTQANRDFADLALNWLLDRTQVLKGIGPRQVTEYRVLMTNAQMVRAQWILLAGLPGGVLTLGGFVWLRRRK